MSGLNPNTNSFVLNSFNFAFTQFHSFLTPFNLILIWFPSTSLIINLNLLLPQCIFIFNLTTSAWQLYNAFLPSLNLIIIYHPQPYLVLTLLDFNLTS